MFVFPFMTLPQIESTMLELSNSVNGKTITFYGWKDYGLKTIPYVVKSNKPIRLFLSNDNSSDGIYVGILNGVLDEKLYYKIEHQSSIVEDNMLITSIYGIVLRRNGRLDFTYFSPVVRKFVLQKCFSELVDAIVEKEDQMEAIANYFANLILEAAEYSFEDFQKFLVDNKLEYAILLSDGFDRLVPVHYVNEENYKNFNLFFYMSLLFWLLYGDVQVKILEY